MRGYRFLLSALCCAWFQSVPSLFASEAPVAMPGQMLKQMHIAMAERGRIKVGLAEGQITGNDNRALQAAVDYVASFGGGLVEIGPGDYLMRDSLHLRPGVIVRGTSGKTVLRKAASVGVPLLLDGDYGEEQFTASKDPGFQVGDGVTIRDRNSGGFHTTVAKIIGRTENTFAISLPLNADCMAQNGAEAVTVFPVISGYGVEGACVEDLTIDGNKEHNANLNGCRGAGIFLYRCPGAVLRGCTIRDYNGDGISFQQSNDVTVENCTCETNAGLGLHPGSGSQRPVVRACVARGNGEDGLFLCWRVKYGLFEGNTLEANGRFGISIGHKDTDNLLRNNRVLANGEDGIFFRDESEPMAGHRNRLESNIVENNGSKQPSAGIRVRGQTHDLVFKDNLIRDTRPDGQRTQKAGIRLEEKVGPVQLEGNKIEAGTPMEDQRRGGAN
jgi:parallel beta-helix repeat protein